MGGSGGTTGGGTFSATDGRVNAEVDLGDISGKWSMISISVANSGVVKANAGNDTALMTANTQVKVTTADGDLFELDASPFIDLGLGGNVTSVEETAGTTYTLPVLLRVNDGSAITVSNVSYTGITQDTVDLSRAFQSNFASYTGGDWCP